VSYPFIAEKGFTLVELMIVIVLVGIVLGIGVPSFQAMMQGSRMTGQYNSLTGSLTYALGFIDADESVLKSAKLDEADMTLANRARVDAGAAAPVARPYIRFGPRGTANWRGAGYFLFCDERGTPGARVANISLAGSVRQGRRDASGNLLNVFNQAVTCP